MSGRAGRRGKDDRGTVIVCADDDLDMDTCKGLMAVGGSLHHMRTGREGSPRCAAAGDTAQHSSGLLWLSLLDGLLV